MPEQVAELWAREWAKEGKKVDWKKLMQPRGFRVLPRRWVVKRTSAWHNAHKKLVWCTAREDRGIGFWIALSNVVIVVRRLIQEGRVRYRWKDRPSRKP